MVKIQIFEFVFLTMQFSNFPLSADLNKENEN